jgi:sulfur relay (sulfurtransferase) DsrC/TusE family protein
MGQDLMNPKKYNIWTIDWQYNSETKEAIRQFQINNELNWKDGIPWKETIWKIIKCLDNFMNSRKDYINIKNLIKGSWRYYSEREINNMASYIIKWDIWTGKDIVIEDRIKRLISIVTPFNSELKKLIEKKWNNNKLNVLNKDERFSITKYDNLIVYFSNKYSTNQKIDPALIKIIIYKESRFNPLARSGAWAKWLMQLMPIAIQEANKWKTIVKNVYDPRQNIEAGVKLFSNHLKTFNWNISLALAAYNAGAGSVKKAGNKIPKNKETRDYVKFITTEYNKLKA